MPMQKTKKVYLSTIPLQITPQMVDYVIDKSCGFKNPKEFITYFPIVTLMRNTVQDGDEIGVILVYEEDDRTQLNYAPLLAEIEKVSKEYSLATPETHTETFWTGKLAFEENGQKRVDMALGESQTFNTPVLSIIKTNTEESISERNKLISKLEEAVIGMRDAIAPDGTVELYIDYTYGEKPIPIVFWDMIEEMELFNIVTPYCVYGAYNFYTGKSTLYNYDFAEKIRKRTVESMKNLLNLPGIDPKQVELAALEYVLGMAEPDDGEDEEE